MLTQAALVSVLFPLQPLAPPHTWTVLSGLPAIDGQLTSQSQRALRGKNREIFFSATTAPPPQNGDHEFIGITVDKVRGRIT